MRIGSLPSKLVPTHLGSDATFRSVCALRIVPVIKTTAIGEVLSLAVDHILQGMVKYIYRLQIIARILASMRAQS